jgi:hypothetical protein
LATADLVAPARLTERFRRLIASGKKTKEQTRARIMIDLGDGNRVPIENAHPDKVREALTALQEKHSKS